MEKIKVKLAIQYTGENDEDFVNQLDSLLAKYPIMPNYILSWGGRMRIYTSTPDIEVKKYDYVVLDANNFIRFFSCNEFKEKCKMIKTQTSWKNQK